MSEKERAEKLAQRFSNKEKNNQQDSEENESNISNMKSSTDTSNISNTSNTNIHEKQKQKEEELGTRKEETETIRDKKTKLMYLDEDLLNQLEITFDEINLMYKRKYGEQLQKNKHYYPKLLEIALKKLENPREKEIEEIENLLDIKKQK